jgi:hypothetical protein
VVESPRRAAGAVPGLPREGSSWLRHQTSAGRRKGPMTLILRDFSPGDLWGDPRNKAALPSKRFRLPRVT